MRVRVGKGRDGEDESGYKCRFDHFDVKKGMILMKESDRL